MKAPSLLMVLMVVALVPFCSKAQNLVYKEATIAAPAEFWEVPKLADGTNVQNGVAFYTHNGDCKSQKVKFVKVVNSNKYDVTLSYQLSKDKNAVIINIPALTSIEGSCSAALENTSKLTLPLGESDEEINKNVDFILSHIFVTESK